MSTQAVTLEIPQPLYELIKSRAQQARRSVETELLEWVASVAKSPAVATVGADSIDEGILRLEREIDQAYDEIRDLVARCGEDPSLRVEIERTNARLRELQEQEADLMERRAESRLRFDPKQGEALLDHAARLLER